MSHRSREPVVLVETRDLFFRAKIDGLVRAAGCRTTRALPADVAVVELGSADAVARVRTLVESGVSVLAFGSHVAVDALREAREAGAQAVPNSQVERALQATLADLTAS